MIFRKALIMTLFYNKVENCNTIKTLVNTRYALGQHKYLSAIKGEKHPNLIAI